MLLTKPVSISIVALLVAVLFAGLATAMPQGINNANVGVGGQSPAALGTAGGSHRTTGDANGIPKPGPSTGGRVSSADPGATGFVYKDVNSNSVYDPSVDVPIPGATVNAYLTFFPNRVIATALTDTSGKYSLSIPQSSPSVYKLTVTLPAGVLSAQPGNPRTAQWKTDYRTIKATDTYQNTHVLIPDRTSQWVTRDIAVDYLPLNYGPTDFSYELWHYGPLFSGKQNAVLVHGISVYVGIPGLLGKGYVRGSSDNVFGGQSDHYSGLAKLLQDKSTIRDGDFYNVWDFEYADALHADGTYYTDSSNTVYGSRLAQVLTNIPQWTGTNQGATVIAHSMGGLVARCAVQLSGAADKMANMICLDSPGIFGGGFGFAKITNAIPGFPPGVYEINPGSELLWRVNRDYTVNKYTFKVLTLAADPSTLLDPSEGNANSRLVECGPDGSVIPGSQSAWAVVPGKDHVGTMDISDTNHPSFQLMKQFLNGGAFTGSPNGKPTFTFVFTHPAITGYPQVILPSGTLIQSSQMIANTYNIGGTTYYAWTIQAGASEHGTMMIYWDATHFVTATLTQSQSAIRKEVIDN